MTARVGRIVAVSAVAALAFTGVAVAAPQLVGSHDHNNIEAQIQAQMPDPRDYSFVALPTQAPPGSAYVTTSHNADSLRSGEAVLFEYPQFTLYACSVVTGHTDPKACDNPDLTLLRTVTRDGVVTRYSVGTKTNTDPATVPLSDTVRDYITSAEVLTRPDWLPDYAEAQIRKMY